MRKVLIFFILIQVFVVFMPFIAVSWDSTIGRFGIMKPIGRDYSLTGTEVNIQIEDDGRILIHEDIGYYFKGRYREVYREPDIWRGAGPHPYIFSVNASCDPFCFAEDRRYEIAGNFNRIADTDARFMLDYDIRNGLIKASDYTGFHYKIWGDQWDKSLAELHGTITLPAEPIEVYFNPIGIADHEVDGNTITYSTGRFMSYLEVRVIMPPDAVSSNTLFQKGSVATVRAEQSFYRTSYTVLFTLSTFASIVILTSMFILPWLIFRKFGSEPDIGYNAVYEREPVKGVKPYVVNSLVMGKTGDTDRNAITATLLDLVRRKHITLRETTKKGMLGSKKDLILEFEDNPRDTLTRPERLVYDYFEPGNGTLVWSEFLKKLRKRSEAIRYMSFVKNFEAAVDKEYRIDKYFDNTGSKRWRWSCFGILVVSLIMLSFSGADNYPFLSMFRIIYVLGIGYSIIGFFIPAKVFGRFTPIGYGIYLKSRNYRKFMTDMTLLKRYPPASIVIWEEVLVYAALFGVASTVIKHLKMVYPDSVASRSGMYPLYHHHVYSSLNSHYRTASSAMSSGGGGSGGGVGGGFGGGGGGAR